MPKVPLTFIDVPVKNEYDHIYKRWLGWKWQAV